MRQLTKVTIVFVGLLGLLGVHVASGQPNSDCPGWKNPTSFTTGNPNFFWTARVGDRTYTSGNYSDTTTGSHIMSTCVNATDITGHANITSTTHNSGSDSYISSCGHNFFDANDKRFQIIGPDDAGTDQFTIAPGSSTGMPRIPPGYTRSIRLGDMRNTGTAVALSPGSSAGTGNNKGSEALFYTMMVTPSNALLFINYAVVARRYSHTAYDAGEFLIRVVKQNDDGTWPNAPINDSLWYKVSAPTFTGSEMPLGWEVGAGNVNNWPCTYAYKPWSKVAISLSRYLNQRVRIELYTSDCIYNADPIYAYISGDYQPMRINASGCAKADSPTIDTLTAPLGLTQYRWFVTTMGPEEDLFNADYMDAVHFRPLTPPSDTINYYAPTIEDFILTEGPNAGDTVDMQTFMCTMVSALDPAKPFTSKLYANLENSKPTAVMSTSSDCNLTVQLTDLSYAHGNNEVNPDSTQWIIYSDSLGTSVLDTLYGPNASYRFPTDGYYLVVQRAMLYNKPCSSLARGVVHAVQTHEPTIAMTESVLCEGEVATAWCTGADGLKKEWSINDSLAFSSDSLNAYDTIQWVPPAGTHTLSLTTSTDGLCPAISTFTFKVIGNSTITSSADSPIVCRGDTVTLSAMGIETPRWVSVPYDSALAAYDGQNVIRVTPQVSTVYTVQPMGDSRCMQNASTISIMVLPYPIPTIWTNKEAVDLTNPTLNIEDRSPYSNSSQWTFSDGQSAEGSRVEHWFGVDDDNVTITLHACNDMRCCADTSVTLPVTVSTFWIPNTFSPSDPSNNIFRFYSTLDIVDFELWIYDRNGHLVYHTTDFEAGWDGKTIDGTPCPQGAYAYQYSYSEASRPTHKHPGIGTVTLLR